MPIRMTVSNRKMPPVLSRQWNNEVQVANQPNPNSGMETFKRNNPEMGTTGPVNPLITGTGESAASANQQLILRGLSHANEENQARLFPTQQVGPEENMNFQPVMEGVESVEHNNPFSGQGTQVTTNFNHKNIGGPSMQLTRGNTLADPRWEGLKQALFEHGADKLTTTAAGASRGQRALAKQTQGGLGAGSGELGFFDLQGNPALSGLKKFGRR